MPTCLHQLPCATGNCPFLSHDRSDAKKGATVHSTETHGAWCCAQAPAPSDEGVPGERVHGEHQVVHDLPPLPPAALLPLRGLRQLHPQVRPPLPLGRQLHRRGVHALDHAPAPSLALRLTLPSPWLCVLPAGRARLSRITNGKPGGRFGAATANPASVLPACPLHGPRPLQGPREGNLLQARVVSGVFLGFVGF